MLSRDDVLNAKEIYLSEHDELLIPVADHNVGYRFTKQTLSWEVTKRWYSWKVYCKALSGEEALKVMDSWKKHNEKESARLNEAIEFATKKHSGQFRKATTIPYILHPLEVLQILYSMRADTNVLIAGVLHDTVEDTDTTLDEIRVMFGTDVAELVASNSEDKSKSWIERKQHTIDELANANERVKMLIMADKLSNIRSIAFDYNQIGDKLWERFNAPKEKQAWYYDGILDALYDMQFIPECEKAYWEITGLFKDVFVKYYLDRENDIIYQACETGTIHYLKKGNPSWNDALAEISDNIANNTDDKPRYYKTNPIPDNAELLSRKDAELTEDMWNKPFWDCHNMDLQDEEYHLFCSKKRCVDIKIINSRLILICADYGKECESINGKDEYEFSYSLDEECTRRFLVQLRMRCGTENSLESILKQEFGKDEAPKVFKNFCDEIGVFTQFYSR